MDNRLIIAEAGINHNGKLSVAKKLVDKAKEAGATAIKFQTFWNISFLKKYELTEKEFIELKEYCDDSQIMFLSTPHTYDAIHFLDKLVPMYKIAGPNLFVGKFLVEVDSKQKPILLSTGNLMSSSGMATIDEISHALSFIKKSKVTLMHCVSKYPCDDPHYDRIEELQDVFTLDVGLSDHSKNIIVPPLKVIERHFMIHEEKSIDSNVSLYPEQFKKMVKYLERQ